MEPIGKIDCACWRLTRPLAGEPLPTHVCDQTAAATIYNGPPLPGAEFTPELTWPVLYDYCVGLGIPSRELGFVIREWAKEKPNMTLAKQLRDSWEWPIAVSSIRGEFLWWRRHYPDEPVSAWVADDAFDRRHAAVLWQRRLPLSSAILRFLRACAAHHLCHRTTRQQAGRLVQATADGGMEDVVLPDQVDEDARYQAAFETVLAEHPEALPARGLLVTTLVFVRTGPIEEYGVRYDPNPELRIEGPSEFATDDVLAAAAKVARKHRDWLRAIGHHHPLAEPGVIHRAKTSALPRVARDPDYYDFVTHAVDLFPALLAKNRAWLSLPPGQLNDQIDRALDKAYSTVRKRRERAHLSSKVDRGWREAARRRIIQEIEALNTTR